MVKRLASKTYIPYSKTVEEHERERTYIIKRWKDVQEGKYVPLWKQKNR